MHALTQRRKRLGRCIAAEDPGGDVTRQYLKHGKDQERHQEQREQRQKKALGDQACNEHRCFDPLLEAETCPPVGKSQDRPRKCCVPGPGIARYLVQLRSSKLRLKFCARGV